jgi:basic membrane protein A
MREKTISRRNALKTVGAAGAFGLAGCLGDSGSGGSAEVSAAFLYESEVGDVGWDRAHEDGRQAVTEKFDWLETEFTEDVSEQDATQVMEQYASSGMDIVFGTTFGFMDPMHELAPDFPDTTFEHCSGFKTRDNMGRYYGRLYQARYLCGVAAGLLTESNQLGYVAAFPIPEVVRQINAFVQGARTVNPDVSANVRWTNAWLDPPATTQATNSLLSGGADVINNHITSPAAVQTAAENEAWAFTYTTTMSDQGGEYYGSSAVFNWEVFYEPTVKAVRNDNWESDAYWGGLSDGVIGVDDFGPQVPDDVVSEVENKQSEIVDGDRTVWQDTQFEGESDEFLFGEMSSYVEGIEGEVPDS